MFSKIEKGSIRSTIFTLFTGTVGGGVLSLPFTFTYFGLFFGNFFLIISAFIIYHSYDLLNTAIMDTGKKSFANVASFYFGKT